MLGAGIYFADSARYVFYEQIHIGFMYIILFSLSCKFSKPGKQGRRTRLMLVNQVALGQCKVILSAAQHDGVITAG